MYYKLLSLFSCNYNSSYMQMYAAMFGWAMYQMMDSNKTRIVRAKEEKLASQIQPYRFPSLRPRKASRLSHGLLNNLSIKKPVRVNIRQVHIWKDVKQAQWNQLWGADDLVKIVFIGEPTIDNNEQGESASKVCLFGCVCNGLFAVFRDNSWTKHM